MPTYRCVPVSAQEDFAEELVLPIEVLPHGEVHCTFVVLGRPEGSLALGRFGTVLRFTVKEIDPSTGALQPAGPQGTQGSTIDPCMAPDGLWPRSKEAVPDACMHQQPNAKIYC